MHQEFLRLPMIPMAARVEDHTVEWRSANYNPWAECSYCLFLHGKVYENTAMPICSCTVYGCFHAVTENVC